MVTTTFLATTQRFSWYLQAQSTNILESLKQKKLLLSGEGTSWQTLKDLPNPFLLADAEKAADRVLRAIQNQEKIVVFADYDVDGTTSASIWVRFFREIQYPLEIYVPDRSKEGYGLSVFAIETLKQSNTNVIVTVDNGISSHTACTRALELGLDVIVTDHHDVPATLPNAYAVVNPKRGDCPFPFKVLSGCGVAFFVLCALRKKMREVGLTVLPNLRTLIDDVAIGTVADCVPILGLNHFLTKIGLQVLYENIVLKKRPGVEALLMLNGWDGDSAIGESDIAFKIGPCLNAAGRLTHARAAFEVLSTEDSAHGKTMAEFLYGENQNRKSIEKEIKNEAIALVEENVEKQYDSDAIVVFEPHWHIGVVGIVAARLVEKFYKPTLVLAGHEGVAKGSGRSTDDFDLYSALLPFKPECIAFGGHPQAVGLTIECEKIPKLEEHLIQAVRAQGKVNQGAKKPIYAQANLNDFSVLEEKFFALQESLQPFGIKHVRPHWIVQNVVIHEIKTLGKDPSQGHAKVSCRDCHGQILEFLFFQYANDLREYGGRPLNILIQGAFEMWKGRKFLRLRIVDFCVESI